MSDGMLDAEMKMQKLQIPFLRNVKKWEFEETGRGSAADFGGVDLIAIRNCGPVPNGAEISLRGRLTEEWQQRCEVGLSVSYDEEALNRLEDFKTAGEKWRVHTLFVGRTVLVQFPPQPTLERCLDFTMKNDRSRWKPRKDKKGRLQFVLYTPLDWWVKWDRAPIELGNIYA